MLVNPPPTAEHQCLGMEKQRERKRQKRQKKKSETAEWERRGDGERKQMRGDVCKKVRERRWSYLGNHWERALLKNSHGEPDLSVA